MLLLFYYYFYGLLYFGLNLVSIIWYLNYMSWVEVGNFYKYLGVEKFCIYIKSCYFSLLYVY